MTKEEFVKEAHSILNKHIYYNQHKKGPPSVIAKDLCYRLMEIEKLLKIYERDAN